MLSRKWFLILFGAKPFLVLLMAALVLGGSAGAVYALGINPINSQEGGRPMSSDDIADLQKQFKDQPQWGFVSRYGRTGIIQSVETKDKTVQVATPRGQLQAKVGEGTAIRETKNGEVRVLTFNDLTPGLLITVDGPTGTEGDAEASEIQVVPQGEGGFQIKPATGSGPHAVPVFP